MTKFNQVNFAQIRTFFSAEIELTPQANATNKALK